MTIYRGHYKIFTKPSTEKIGMVDVFIHNFFLNCTELWDTVKSCNAISLIDEIIKEET